jgi:proton glutamate symport protein
MMSRHDQVIRSQKEYPLTSNSSKAFRICVGGGLFLFAAGCLLLSAFPGHSWVTALRWAGLLLLVFAGARRRSLTYWIFLAVLLGLELGLDKPQFAEHLRILSDIFLRLIKVIIAPLLFAVIVVGIASQADIKKVGRLGLKSLIYFEVVSTIAMLVGLAAVNLSRPGASVHLPPAPAGQSLNLSPHSATQLITDVFPENIAKSVAEGQVLQIVVFSILFAFALSLVPEPKRRPLLVLAESLSATMFKFTNIVMYAAPLGVLGAVAYTVGHMGLSVFLPLLKLLATMYVALVFFVLAVLLPILLLVRIPLKPFLRVATEPVTLGFATASSEATLPRAMELLEDFGVPRQIVAFVLPTGYSFNMDGASLYQSLALIFVAQAAGIHLSFGQQTVMILTLLLSSKGTAGVARASFLIVFGAATSFHFPMEPLFLLFAIDQLMDMGRTAVTVLGNCVACVVIARWEGALNLPKASDSALA